MNLEEMSAEVLLSKIYCRTENYQDVEQELLSRLAEGERAKEAMRQIGDLVYNNSCHVDTSNAVTRIFQQYRRGNEQTR